MRKKICSDELYVAVKEFVSNFILTAAFSIFIFHISDINCFIITLAEIGKLQQSNV